MTGVYKRCPFCERVFDVTDDGVRLRRHIRVVHPDPDEGRSIESERPPPPAR